MHNKVVEGVKLKQAAPKPSGLRMKLKFFELNLNYLRLKDLFSERKSDELSSNDGYFPLIGKSHCL